MEPDGDPQSPTSWYQPPTNLRHRRRPQPSPLLNPVSLILAIPIVTLFIIFFLVPPFLHHSNQILRLNSVKRSWDSLNIMLVVFAILCGVFARRDEEAPRQVAAAAADNKNMGRVPSVSRFASTRTRQSFPAWHDFPDRREYNNISRGGGSGSGSGGLRRSKSSYPDLRQKSLWESMGGGDRSRFFDDFAVYYYRSAQPKSPANSESRGGARPSFEADREVEVLVKEIPVDKFEVRSDPPVPTPSPPPLSPSSAADLKRRRSVQSVPRRENAETRQRSEPEFMMNETRRPMPPPAPPPPPPTASRYLRLPEVGNEKSSRKKSSATKEIATTIASLYRAGQRKRNKRSEKTRNIYETTPHNSWPQPQSTPPPPPPPPSKLLQSLFKKNSKSKRVHSVPTTVPPPPPPPPPPNSILNNLFKTGSKRKGFQQTSASPPSSILNSPLKNGSKSRRFNNVTTITPPAPPPPPPSETKPSRRRQVITGRPPNPTKSVFVAPLSPLIPLPPPPPLPPLKISNAKFVARGDFVRMRSTHSSRSNSPELEDVDVEVSAKSEVGDRIGPSITCPSPDVNVKADTFIARLRDEWRLEKINSIREKQT